MSKRARAIAERAGDLRVVDLVQIAQSLSNGLVFGAILALCAIGLTLIYGILNLSNFAHGDLLTFGAYMALFFGHGAWWGYQTLVPVGAVLGGVLLVVPALDMLTRRILTRAERLALAGFGVLVLAMAAWIAVMGTGGSGTTTRVLILATLLAIAATVLVTLLFELVLWRPLRRRGATVMSLVIASLGLSLVVRNGIQTYFGGDYRSLDRTVDEAATYFGVHFSDESFVILGVAAGLIVGVHLFLSRTRVGKAMRALADDRDLARVCGIDVDRIVVYVWVVAGALVAVAGVMLSLVQNNNVQVNMGFGILIPIFASVVVGGIGSPYGAMLGGLVVGIAMRIGPAKYDLALAFAILIAVLLFRPEGLAKRAETRATPGLDLRRPHRVALACALAVLVGCFAPWYDHGAVAIGGLERGGALAALLGVAALVALFLVDDESRRSWIAGVALALAAAMGAYAHAGVFEVAGWGLHLMIAAGLVGAAAALAGRPGTRLPRLLGGPA